MSRQPHAQMLRSRVVCVTQRMVRRELYLEGLMEAFVVHVKSGRLGEVS